MMQYRFSFHRPALALLVLACVGFYFGCKDDKPVPPPPVVEVKPTTQLPVPAFSADTAFAFVKKQVDFGPRVPNTKGHKACAAWMAQTLRGYGLEVIEQKYNATHYLGTSFEAINVIGQYKPEQKRRIMIAAHWDSRFHADKDTKDKAKPIDGADDGASGVGVILEIARVLAANPVDIGVDFVLFDVEDQGNDSNDGKDNGTTWCLGSQYWAKNRHKPGYFPYSAILLDMVGAKGATFKKEGLSTQYAPKLVGQIWGLANTMGYGNYFVSESIPGITDDHYFLIKDANIPMIDIINTQGEGEKLFGAHHHTHADNMAVIDKNTLKAVGQVMVAYIYRTYNGTM
jgi:glutaminyl-peptide cyclotransferase